MVLLCNACTVVFRMVAVRLFDSLTFSEIFDFLFDWDSTVVVAFEALPEMSDMFEALGLAAAMPSESAPPIS